MTHADQNIAKLANATGAIGLTADLVSHVTQDPIFPHVSLVGGMVTDALNLSKEYHTNKHLFWKDLGVDAAHYLPMVTQFLPLTAPLVATSTILTMGSGLYQLLQPRHNLVPSLLSSVRSLSTQGRMFRALLKGIDICPEATFGSTYYGRLTNHPRLVSYHREMVKLKREFANVPIGMARTSNAYGVTNSLHVQERRKYTNIGVTLNLPLIHQRATRFAVGNQPPDFEEHVRYTVMHEYAHVSTKLHYNEDPEYYTRRGLLPIGHDEVFQQHHNDLYKRARVRHHITPGLLRVVKDSNAIYHDSNRTYETVSLDDMDDDIELQELLR